MRPAVGWASEDLTDALAALTSQQATGVIRIVEAEIDGRTLTSLLEGDDRICAYATYYGRGKSDTGWKDKPEFQRALELARRDYRKWLLEHSTSEAMLILASTAPEATRALRQQISGEPGAVAALQVALQAEDPEIRKSAAMQLGDTGLASAVPALKAAYDQEQVPEVRETMVHALGRIAGFRDGDRRAAIGSVLSRVSEETAEKNTMQVQGNPDRPVEYVDVTERELEGIRSALIDASQAEGSGEA
jgi:hypothetical protein